MALTDILNKAGGWLAKNSSTIAGLGSAGLGIVSNIINSGNSGKSQRRAYEYAIRQMNHQFDLNSRLMDKQQTLTRDLNRSAYQDTTYSMRQAGINPMLAITQGVNGLSAGGSSVGTPSGPSAPVPELDLNSALSSYMDYKRYKNETNVSESVARQNSASAKQMDVNTKMTQAQLKYADAIAKQELNNKKLEGEAIKSNIKQTNSNTSLIDQNVNSAKANNVVQDAEAQWIKNNPKAYNFKKGFESYAGAIGTGLGLLGGSAYGAFNMLKYRHKPVGFSTR